MNGLQVPADVAHQQAVKMKQQMLLTQFRMGLARELQHMFLAKAVQPFQADEPWQEGAAGANAVRDAVQIATEAVQHADALMEALGFRVQTEDDSQED